ncbi:MAG: hypothetical protein KJ047_15360 [Anaerolineae bacterium]|nr:hypothetical protein [Anaerolineae bacterium]
MSAWQGQKPLAGARWCRAGAGPESLALPEIRAKIHASEKIFSDFLNKEIFCALIIACSAGGPVR